MAYKVQQASLNYVTMLMWASLSEILLYTGVFFTFFAAAARLGPVWLQLVHVARGVCGMVYVVSLPRTHDMIDRLECLDPQKNENQG